MKTYYLPDDLIPDQASKADEVVIRCYQSNQNTEKNRLVLNRNMINLLISGTKTILYPDATATVCQGELVVLSTGNILTSEVVSGHQPFTSILVYFSNELLNRFLIKYHYLLHSRSFQSGKQPFLIYQQDTFIRQFIGSIQALLASPTEVPAEIKQIKLEELLLYLLHMDPSKLQSLQIVSKDRKDLQLKKVVESHISQVVTVDELAFLCHMSPSSFKRKFSQLYGTSPQKWLLREKLLLAAELLKSSSESPSQIYFKVGYHNHSSFSQAFRQQFGCPPSEYQRQQLSAQR